jgi:phosphoribosylformylglycinamidine cyclo-ligase
MSTGASLREPPSPPGGPPATTRACCEVAPNLGIALSGPTASARSSIVAEQAGRYDTVGIDCVAMNVNDVVCVGAEPIALLDYLAVEQADPEVLRGDRRRA